MRRSLLVLVAVVAAFFVGWTARPLAAPPGPPRVTGIGGVFFKCQDPAKLKAWYAEHFGMHMDQYGALFEFRSTDDPTLRGFLQWSAFGPRSTYFKPGNKDFMVNYRVTGIGTLLQKLRASGATIMDSATYDYGTFAHVLDPDSTLIELWEPVDTALHVLDGRTTTH